MNRFSSLILRGSTAAALFVFPLSASPEFSAQVAISPRTLDLTDTLTVSLTVTYPEGYQLVPGILRDHLLQAPFSVKTEKSSTQRTPSGQMQTQMVYTLEPWAVGTQWISFYDISLLPKPGFQGKKVVLSADILPVTILDPPLPFSALPTADLLPLSLRPMAEIDRSTQLALRENESQEPLRNLTVLAQHEFPWALVIITTLLATLGIGVAALLRYRDRKGEVAQKESPGKIATAHLDALEQSGLAANREFGAFFVQLTAIVRRYIEERTGIQAEEQTTQEFLNAAAFRAHFSPEARQLLADLLSYADQVKFARQPSTAADCVLALSYAREFVRLTDVQEME